MKFAITLFILFISLAVNAQDSVTTTKKKKFIKASVSAGVRFITMPGLFTKLKNLGYKTSQAPYFEIGVGWEYESKKLIGGFDLMNFMLSYSDDYSSTAMQIQGYLNYKIIDNKKLMIAPGLHIGYQKVNMALKLQRQSNIFDSVVIASGNSANIYNAVFYTGASAIFLFKENGKKKRLLFPLPYCIRIGYNYGLQNSAWKSNGNELINSPSDRASSFYIQALGWF